MDSLSLLALYRLSFRRLSLCFPLADGERVVCRFMPLEPVEDENDHQHCLSRLVPCALRPLADGKFSWVPGLQSAKIMPCRLVYVMQYANYVPGL